MGQRTRFIAMEFLWCNYMKMEYLSQFIYNLSWLLHPHSTTGYLMAKWQICHPPLGWILLLMGFSHRGVESTVIERRQQQLGRMANFPPPPSSLMNLGISKLLRHMIKSEHLWVCTKIKSLLIVKLQVLKRLV